MCLKEFNLCWRAKLVTPNIDFKPVRTVLTLLFLFFFFTVFQFKFSTFEEIVSPIFLAKYKEPRNGSRLLQSTVTERVGREGKSCQQFFSRMKTPGHSLSHKLTCHKQDVWNTSNLLTSCCYLPPCYVRFCSNNHCAAADTWHSKHRARPNPIDWPIVIDVQSSFLSHCPTTIQFNYWISACLMFPILNLLLLQWQ